MFFNIVVCTDYNYGIGKNNDMPWHFNKDLQHFKILTIGDVESSQNKYNVVIMGNNTYNSIPSQYRPLNKRINIILSRSNISTDISLLEDIEYIKHNPIYFNNINNLLLFLDKIKKYVNDCFVIGGSQIYNIFLDLKLINKIYLTKIKNKNYECDTFFNLEVYKKQFELKSNSNYIDIDKKSNNIFILINYEYDYINKEENKFIKTVNKILNKGVYNLDRSGVGTMSTFGKSFTYDIRNYRLPLFTHRKVFLRGIIEELLFFISGKTDTKILEEKNVNIWKGHTSREFLDSRSLQHYKEGSYGPSYGFQLRHFNADFIDDNSDYTGKGFDQLEDVINQIKNNPTSRRILFTYWNPSALNKVPLPNCHILYQFHVNIETKELSCSFYQRSNDYMLAGVYNICSASILVFMLCHLTGYKPGKIIHNIGNIHIYMNQIEVVKEIIKNKPFNFPLLFIEDPKEEIKTIDDFTYEHFKLIFYNSHKKYNITMSV
jgi:dihydrofolate reductase/thymidylate synthase